MVRAPLTRPTPSDTLALPPPSSIQNWASTQPLIRNCPSHSGAGASGAAWIDMGLAAPVPSLDALTAMLDWSPPRTPLTSAPGPSFALLEDGVLDLGAPLSPTGPVYHGDSLSASLAASSAGTSAATRHLTRARARRREPVPAKGPAPAGRDLLEEFDAGIARVRGWGAGVGEDADPDPE